ncbi:nuclear transport factor 2 family protein [Amycolatopsis pithecellobii]|uniref:SnoaL-like domain-containing protein n=1 Tax=Amycolatopsis pithecellobii TaxID=664692 RepID=A0A6N7ZAQ9_9PSEU|nr:nuclear transport factor 2 family protein [Amycolatopsis pithecellobii]MTD58846.1 hypothetical protein [Amycolatopsis pithecellobii]
MTETAKHERSPLDLAEAIRLTILGKDADEDLFAEDAVYEIAFAVPGTPDRVEGRDAIIAHMKAVADGPAATLLDIKDVQGTYHRTDDDAVVVMEFRVTGERSTDHTPFEFRSSIGVLTVRHGRIAHWRDYPNAVGGAAAAGFLKQFAELLIANA